MQGKLDLRKSYSCAGGVRGKVPTGYSSAGSAYGYRVYRTKGWLPPDNREVRIWARNDLPETRRYGPLGTAVEKTPDRSQLVASRGSWQPLGIQMDTKTFISEC